MTRRFLRAQELLDELGISEPENIDLDAIAQYTGATVQRAPLASAEARIVGAGDEAVITINEKSLPSRQRFSISLPPGATVAGFPVLMPNDKDSNARFECSVYDRDPERKDSSPSRSWCAEARVLDQEIGDTLELAKKALCYEWPGLLCIELQGVGDIMFGARVKRKRHRESLDRRRAKASSPGTAVTDPESSSASLRSASRSQASSTSGSESRLAMSRSRRCERSAKASFRTSASKASKLVLMLFSKAEALNSL